MTLKPNEDSKFSVASRTRGSVSTTYTVASLMSCTSNTAKLSGDDASGLRAAHGSLDAIHAPRVTGLIERHYCQRAAGYGASRSNRAHALGSLRCAAVTRQ